MLRIYLLLYSCLISFSVHAESDVWLLIDTTARKIEIKKGEQTLEILKEIAIGRGGAGLKNHRGDNITPFGDYKIGWIGEKSNFRRLEQPRQRFGEPARGDWQAHRIIRETKGATAGFG